MQKYVFATTKQEARKLKNEEAKMTKDIRGEEPSMAFHLSVTQALLLGRGRSLTGNT